MKKKLNFILNLQYFADEETTEASEETDQVDDEVSILKEQIANLTGELAKVKADFEQLSRDYSAKSDEAFKTKEALNSLEQQFKNGQTINEEKNDNYRPIF